MHDLPRYNSKTFGMGNFHFPFFFSQNMYISQLDLSNVNFLI